MESLVKHQNRPGQLELSEMAAKPGYVEISEDHCLPSVFAYRFHVPLNERGIPLLILLLKRYSIENFYYA